MLLLWLLVMALPSLDTISEWDALCMRNVNDLRVCNKCGVAEFGLESFDLTWSLKRGSVTCPVLTVYNELAPFVLHENNGVMYMHQCHRCTSSPLHRARFLPQADRKYVQQCLRVPFPQLHTLSFMDIHMDIVNEAVGYIHGNWGQRSLVACPLLCMSQSAHLTTTPLTPAMTSILNNLMTTNYLYSKYQPLLVQPNVFSSTFLPSDNWKHIVTRCRERAPVQPVTDDNAFAVASFRTVQPVSIFDADILSVGTMTNLDGEPIEVNVGNKWDTTVVWENAMFPYMFPEGTGMYSPIKSGTGKHTSFSDYVTHRALQAFSLFTLQPVYIMLMHQIQQTLTSLRQVKKVRVLQTELRTYQRLHPKAQLSDALTSILHDAVPHTAPNSPQYFANKLRDLKACAFKKGMPHAFVTVTVDETNMPEYKEITGFLARFEKCWKDAPIECSRVFLARWKTLLENHILAGEKVLGDVDEYVLRYECQGRQSLHIHMCVWLKTPEDVDNLKQNLTCRIPAEYCTETKAFIVPDKDTDPVQHRLFNLVMDKQQHSCWNTYTDKPKACSANDRKQCDKNFPNKIHEAQTPAIHPQSGRYMYHCPRLCDVMTVVYLPALLLFANAHVNVQLVREEEWSFYMLKYSLKPAASGAITLTKEQGDALGFGALTAIERAAALCILQTTPLSANEITLHVTDTQVVHNSMEVLYFPCHTPVRRTSVRLLVGNMQVKISLEQLYCGRPSKNILHVSMDNVSYIQYFSMFEIISPSVLAANPEFDAEALKMKDSGQEIDIGLSPLLDRVHDYIGRDSWGNAVFRYNRPIIARFTDVPPDKDIQQFAYRILMESLPYRSELELFIADNPSYVNTCVHLGFLGDNSAVDDALVAYAKRNFSSSRYTSDVRSAILSDVHADALNNQHVQNGFDPRRLAAELHADLAARISHHPSPEQSAVVSKIAKGKGIHILSGGAGTGKTSVTRLLALILLEQNRFVCLSASTATAANILSRHATTNHKIFKISTATWSHQPFTLNDASYLILSTHNVFIIDEFSMVTIEVFRIILIRIQTAQKLKSIAEVLLYNLIVLVGDHAQLPCVCNCSAAAFLRGVCTRHSILHHHLIKEAYFEGRYHNLTEVHRSAGDFARFCNVVRNASEANPLTQSYVDIHFNNHCLVQRPSISSETIFICSHKKDVKTYNASQLLAHCMPDDIHKVLPRVTVRGDHNSRHVVAIENLTEAQATWVDSLTKHDMESVCVGAPIRLTKNKDASSGLSNGTVGVVERLIFANDTLNGIVVKTEHGALTTLTRFMIAQKDVAGIWTQVSTFGANLNYATTAHAVQGRSITGPIVIDIVCFVAGLGYVAITRATDINNIQVVRRLTPEDLRVINVHDFFQLGQ